MRRSLLATVSNRGDIDSLTINDRMSPIIEAIKKLKWSPDRH
ncbi:hypothetical protein CES86_3198 [Brucella lupini]|uniref:Uncharacterized protein n=1 Tax=Brucella lupini TaxID=255457 RepID=A0A256GJ06_9HYPH|nr:hypothetical protein CES86_3198 [Brucella lupini]